MLVATLFCDLDWPVCSRIHPRCDVTGSLLEMAGPLTGNVRIIDRPEVLILFVTTLCHKEAPACRCLKASADVAFVSFIRPHFASRFPHSVQ